MTLNSQQKTACMSLEGCWCRGMRYAHARKLLAVCRAVSLVRSAEV